MDEQTKPHRPLRFNLVPRFRLRTLLFGVLLASVLIRAGQWAWPRYLQFRAGREYVALQATKDSEVLANHEFLKRGRLEHPGMISRASDRSRPVPDNFVVLVRRGNVYGCFIPRNQHKSSEALEYDWFYRTDGQGHFNTSDPNVKSGHSSTGPYIRGDLVQIKFGPFAVEWSGGGPGWGYLYHDLNDSAKGRLEICSTNLKTIELLDAADSRWGYHSYVPLPEVSQAKDLIPSPLRERKSNHWTSDWF